MATKKKKSKNTEKRNKNVAAAKIKYKNTIQSR